MAQLALPAFTLSADRLFGPITLPAGLSQFTLTLDVGLFLPGQVMWLRLEGSADGGATWHPLCTADFTGPSWTDKSGATRTDVSLSFNLGSKSDGQGGRVPRVTNAGDQLRAGALPVNGPIQVGAGSLVGA